MRFLLVASTLIWSAHSFVQPRVGVVHQQVGSCGSILPFRRPVSDPTKCDGSFPIAVKTRRSIVKTKAQDDGQSPVELEKTTLADGTEVLEISGYEYRFDLNQVLLLFFLQAGWIGLAALVAWGLHTPNFGLGPGIAWNGNALQTGLLYTAPLGIFAFIMDKLEARIPALKEVALATQRSILTIMGGVYRPIPAVITAVALGIVAGLGEEMAFRGVLQYELANSYMNGVTSIATTSVLFGALHAVTPLYALFAGLASIYFGWLYNITGNLAVPIIAHGVYDIGALFITHLTVSKLPMEEQEKIANWVPSSMRDEDASSS